MILDHFVLDVLNCIRLNGYEVATYTRDDSTIITIFDLERNAETCVALTAENRLSLMDRLAGDYCTAQQQEGLFLNAGATLSRVA